MTTYPNPIFDSLSVINNVGIGTNSPAGKLEVIGTSGSVAINGAGDQISFNYDAYTYLTSSGTSATLQIQATGANGQITAATNGIERIRVSASGNVGIGTNTPDNFYSNPASLAVVKNQNAITQVAIGNNVVGASASARFFMVGGTANSYAFSSLVDNNGTPFYAIGTGSGVTSGIIVNTEGPSPVVLATNNAERLRVTPGGNVGIGTSTPNNYGAGYTTVQAQGSAGGVFRSVGGSAVADFYADAAGIATLRTIGPYALSLQTNSAERLYVDTNGDVGIGSRPSGVKFKVDVNKNSSDGIYVTNTSSGASAQAVVQVSTLGRAGFAMVQNRATGEAIIYQAENAPLVFATNAAIRMAILGSGNVGIGTAAPGYKLEVASNANSNDGIYVSNTNTGASAQAVVNVAAQGWNGVQLVQNRATGTAQVYLGDNAPLLLATNATTRMTILGSGKIGVGTDIPGSYVFPAQGGQTISSQFVTVGTSTLGPSVTGPVPTNGEFGLSIDFTSNTGKYTGAAGTVASNKVGFYVSATAEANSGNIWAFNPLLYLKPGSVAAGSAQIAELDLAQLTGVNYGDTPGYAGFLQPAVLGMQLTGIGYRATAALAILGQGETVGTPLWNRGIVANAFSIAQSFLEDYSSATQSYYLAGAHTYGINTIDGTFSEATIRLGAQQKISWRNQANSANLNMLQSTGTDDLIIGTGAASLFFNASGASRVKITSAGFVGINTLSPVSQVHVVGGSDSVNILTVTGPTYGVRLGSSVGTGATIQAVDSTGVSSPQPLYISGTQVTISAGSGANGIFIAPSGNVGIGTVSPGYKLHVASSTNGNDGLFVSNTSTGASAQAFINLVAQGWNGIQLVQTQATGNIQFYSGDNVPMSFSTNASTRMFIAAAGNVGIGTTSPSSELHINGADSANIATVTGASYGVRIGSAAGTGGTIAGVDSTGVASYQPLYISGTQVTIGVNGGANGLVVDTNANVYTTSPVSTTMNNGFFYIPGTAGVPTGTPTAVSNHVAMYYDTTGHDLWVYDGVWKKVHLN